MTLSSGSNFPSAASSGWTDQQVQIGHPSSGPPLHRFDIRIQYRLLDDTGWGKTEFYLGPSYVTRQDVPDRLVAVGCLGHTLGDAFRLEGCHHRELNIGRSHPERGIAEWLAGASLKLIQTADFLADVYGWHYLKSNVGLDDPNQIKAGDPIRWEVGSRVHYRLGRHFTVTVAPYVQLHDSFDRIGVHPLLRANLGAMLPVLPRELAAEVGGNFSTDYQRDERALWLRLMWELR